MNADDLARQALASGYEEAVEVNQRALVQKILARYSVGFFHTWITSMPWFLMCYQTPRQS